MININIKNSVKCNGEYSLFMSFPYDNYIVDTIRNCPTRYWDKDNKEWELPLNKLNDIVDKLNNYQITITGESVCFEPKKLEVPKSFNFKTQPFQHQIEGFNYGLTHDKWLLADEQGLGKSKQVIDIALALRDKENLKHCLIVCGVNGLKWNWYNEVSTHSNEKGYILGQRIKRKKITIPGNKTKLEDVNNLKNIDNFFIITNIETLRSAEIASKLAEYCQDGTIGMVACDESHKCFDYDCTVTTDIGQLKIGDIVTQQIHCSVLSYNEKTGDKEWKRIEDWYENTICEQLLELEFETEQGIKTIKCTKGHRFFTKNRGWVRAEDLTSYDDIEEI